MNYNRDVVTEWARRLEPFLLNLIAETAGNDWFRIWVVHYDGTKPEDFDVTDAGLAAAILVAESQDTILIPPGTFANNYTFPASIKVHGAGSLSTIFTGQITGSAGGYMRDIRIARTANDAGTLLGLIVSATGTLALNTVTIELTQSGSGAARAISCTSGGSVKVRGSYIEANTAGGIGSAVHVTSGRVELHDSEVLITSSAGDVRVINQENTGVAYLWNVDLMSEADNLGYTIRVSSSTDLEAYHCRFYNLSGGVETTPFLAEGTGDITLLSDVGAGKSFNLWNGSSNDAPPADWETTGFDDSAWPTTVAATYPPPLTGTDSVKNNAAHPAGAKQLLRHSFSVGTPADVRLQVRVEDWIPLGIYLNGVQVVSPISSGGTAAAYNSVDIDLDSTDLQAGTNVLAMEIQNGDGYAIGVSYRLDSEGGGNIKIYACQFPEEFVDDCELLSGDRSAYNIEDYSPLHASDILNDVLLRHLPDPIGQPDGYIAYVLNDQWVVGASSEIVIPEMDEIRIESTKAAKGASAPADALRDVGASGDLKMPVIQFSEVTQQDVYFIFHYPTNIDFTQDVEFHLMWIPGAAWTSGNYMWKLEYLTKNENGGDVTAGVPTTIQMDVTPASADLLIETEFTDTISIGDDEILICHFYRDVANDNGDDVGEVLFFEIAFWTTAEEGDVLTDDDLLTLTDDDDNFLMEA